MEEGRLLAVMATPVEAPEVVDRNRWPVHVTIAGNFLLDDASTQVVADLVARVASDTVAFSVPLGPRFQFGSERSIPVLLAEHPALHLMHESLARELSRLPGFAPAEPASWDDGYRPHATLGSAVDVADGDALSLHWLALASLQGDLAQRIQSVEFPTTGASEL